jgi:hypothetical protein
VRAEGHETALWGQCTATKQARVNPDVVHLANHRVPDLSCPAGDRLPVSALGRIGFGTRWSQGNLAQRVTSVDEQAASGCQGGAQARKGLLAGFGMAAVEGANAHGEGEVEGGLVLLEDEVLDSHLTEAENTSLDLGARAGLRLGDGSRRAVDAQDVTGTDPAGNLAGGCAGSAADLQDADASAQGQGVDHGP